MRRSAPRAALLTLSLWASGTFLPGLVPPRAPDNGRVAGAACGRSSCCMARTTCAAATDRPGLSCGCCHHRGATAVPGAAQWFMLPQASQAAPPLPDASEACARPHPPAGGSAPPEAPPPRA